MKSEDSALVQPCFNQILGGVALQLDGRFGVVVDLRQAVLQRSRRMAGELLGHCWI